MLRLNTSIELAARAASPGMVAPDAKARESMRAPHENYSDTYLMRALEQTLNKASHPSFQHINTFTTFLDKI